MSTSQVNLQETYDNPRLTTRNPAILAKRAGTSVANAKRFLNSLESVQLGKQALRPPVSEMSPTGDKIGTYLCDVVFLKDYASLKENQKRSCILTLLEVNSRFAICRGLKSASSAQTAEALEDILQQVAKIETLPKIVKIRCDGGAEFKGDFEKLCNRTSPSIEIEITQAGTHERLSRLDRFHGTFRRIIGDLFDSTDSHIWYPHLQELTANYNSRIHSALKPAGKNLAPEDITEQKEKKLIASDMQRASAVRSIIDKKAFADGDLVRLRVMRTREGNKASWAKKANDANFTRKVYTIISRVGANSYLVDVPAGEVSVWPHSQLRKAVGVSDFLNEKNEKSEKSEKQNSKVDRKIVQAKRQEARNISDIEQFEALLSPARPKREVKKPVKLNL